MFTRPASFLASLLLIVGSAHAGTQVWKTEPFDADCQKAAGPKVDKDGNLLPDQGDFVLNRCKTKYGPTMWVLYLDSARVSIGFGERPTATFTGASLTRGNWPMEWGGSEANGAFRARSLTIRFAFDGDQSGSTSLFVYKINENQPGCLVAIVDPGADQNQRARKIAEAIDANTKCDREPDPLDDVMN